MIDFHGDVLAARNLNSGYSGFERVPDPERSAAVRGDPIPVGDTVVRPREWAPNEQALDGEDWVVVW